MLVQKRVEMWHAVQSENAPGVWVLTDSSGNKSEISDDEFHAQYVEVPDRHESRRQKVTIKGVLEATEADGEVQTDQ